MDKDELLQEALYLIEAFENGADAEDYYMDICRFKEALTEQPTVAELNDEYLRDTYVEGLNKPRIALEKATKAWYDVDLTGQTNLECARNWFIEGYVQALEFPPKAKTQQPTQELNDLLTYGQSFEKDGKAIPIDEVYYTPKQEPMIIKQGNGLVLKLGFDDLPNGTPFYTHPPKERQGISNDMVRAIGEKCQEENRGILNWIDFYNAIEAKLRERNI